VIPEISVSGCAGNILDMRDQHFWGFPFYHPGLRGSSLCHPLDEKKSLSNASTAIENQTFSAGVKYI